MEDQQLVIETVDVIGQCEGCNNTHNGKLAVSLEIIRDLGPCLLIGVEDGPEFHVIHCLALSHVPCVQGKIEWRIGDERESS